MFDTLLNIVGLGFSGMYGLAPLLVYSQNKQPERFRLHSVPKESVWEETEARFHELADEIETNGFRYIDASEFALKQTKTCFMLFVHDEKKLSILLTQISTSNVQTLIYVEVSQHFEDDTTIDVLNASMDSVFPPSPKKVTFPFPDIKSVSELVFITEKIIASYLSPKTPTTLPKGRELETIADYLNKEQDELIKKGYLQKDAKDGLREMTLKGAYLLTWKLLWPVKQIRRAQKQSFVKKILAEA